jgi:hypothetical protein
MPPAAASSPSPHGLASQSEPETTSFGAWTLVWILYLTKLVTIILVVWAEHSYRAAVFVTITTWFWFGPMLALGAAPLLFKLRLRRVRARRAALMRAEWLSEAITLSAITSTDAPPEDAGAR